MHTLYVQSGLMQVLGIVLPILAMPRISYCVKVRDDAWQRVGEIVRDLVHRPLLYQQSRQCMICQRQYVELLPARQ